MSNSITVPATSKSPIGQVKGTDAQRKALATALERGGKGTLKDLGLSPYMARQLMDAEALRAVGTQPRNGKGSNDRGRPASVFAFTSKGRGRAQRAAKALAAQEAVAA